MNDDSDIATDTESVVDEVVDEAQQYAANMRIWDRVKVTDPKMQKKVNMRGGFTAVDPQWQLQQATKLWGPYGDKWGLSDMKWTTVQVDDSTATALILEARFRYPSPSGLEVSFPIINDEKFKVGDDVFKKLLTNTRSKALSWLGFSADVFMGKFDDMSYVRDLEIRFGDQNAMVQTVMAAVKVAKDQDELNRCRKRLQEMIANETIEDKTIASQLLAEVANREQQLISQEGV